MTELADLASRAESFAAHWPDFDPYLPGPTHLVNLRDVAGHIAALRPGVLFRSDAPRSTDTPPAMQPWPPATVIDLRRHEETALAHPYSRASKILRLPLHDPAAAVSAEATKRIATRGLQGHYLHLLTQCPELFVAFIQMFTEQSGSVLIHCAAGKDRTGITVALLLRLAGIDRESVVADYCRTEESLPHLVSRLFHGQFRSDPPTRQELADKAARYQTLPPALFRAPAEAINAVLDYWDTAAGEVTGWYLAAGGSESILDALRHRVLR